MNIPNFLNSLKEYFFDFAFFFVSHLWQLEKMTDTFEFFTGLRGFHVYCSTVNWSPYIGQNIIFKCEYKNKQGRFALAGEKDRIALITAGHVPMQDGAQFEATVHNKKVRPFPLVQGELEIPITVKVVWPLVERLSIYITKEIKYPVTGGYVNDSKEILKELVGPEAVESLDDDEDEKLGDTEDENCKEIIE